MGFGICGDFLEIPLSASIKGKKALGRLGREIRKDGSGRTKRLDMSFFFSQFSSARGIGSDTVALFVYILHPDCFFLKFSRLGKNKGGRREPSKTKMDLGVTRPGSILTKVGEGRTGDPANQLSLIVGGSKTVDYLYIYALTSYFLSSATLSDLIGHTPIPVGLFPQRFTLPTEPRKKSHL